MIVTVISIIHSKYNEHLHLSVSYAYVCETNLATDAAKRARFEFLMVLLELAVVWAVRSKWEQQASCTRYHRPETFWRRGQAINLSPPSTSIL
jgi:hypothetical protein